PLPLPPPRHFPYTTLFRSTWPLVGSYSRMIVRPSVLLPQPDSPTMPSVSPLLIFRLTPSTAASRCLRPRKPLPTPKPLTTAIVRSEEHTSELQPRADLVCR